MSLDRKAVAITAALLWGGIIFLVGLGNLMFPDYGQALLEVAASIYPGYSVDGDLGSVIVGTLYGLLDGFIGGWVAAWLYNSCARSKATS